MWFCRIGNSADVLGPLTDEQLRQLAREGRIQASDLVSHNSAGPWYLAKQVRGLFAETRAQSAAPPSPPEIPTLVPASPSNPGAEALELLRQEKARRREQARRRTVRLVWIGLALFVVLIGALLWPTASRLVRSQFAAKTTAKQSPADTGRIVGTSNTRSGVELDIPELDEILGVPLEKRSKSPAATPPQESQKAASQTPTSDRLDQLTRLIKSGAVFGTTPSKRRDRQGSVEIQIEECQVAPASIHRVGQEGLVYQTSRPHLILSLRITNSSTEKSVTYTPPKVKNNAAEMWWEGASKPVTPWQRAGYTVDGEQVKPVSLGPGEAVVDVLVFEPPPENAPLVFVRLPASCANVPQDFLFAIAKEEIEWPEPPTAEDVPSDEASLGPLNTAGTAQAKGKPAGSDAPTKEKDTPTEDDEGIPIPGVHDQ